MKRRRLIALTSALGLLGAGGGWTAYRLRAARTVKDVLPTFVDPGPGSRAPSARAFGFTVGATSLASLQAEMIAAGLDCPDTSMRGMMQKMRAEKTREIEAVRARGGDVDSVTGASMVKRKSPKEANPQVRLACADVPATAVEPGGKDAAPAVAPATQDVRGRLLFVFDSARHPLRHVSFERTYPATEVAAALADVARTRLTLATQYGPASAGPAEVRELMWLAPVEVKWTFADLNVRLSATNWGARGIVVSEIVEVPWPVRADAPAQALTAAR